MANLDISERRLPQDGRIKIRINRTVNVEIDFRVSSLPTLFGERSFSVFSTRKACLWTHPAGLRDGVLKRFEHAVKRPMDDLVTAPPAAGRRALCIRCSG
jgi:type IV pilus assembly protein PilB